MFLQRRHDPGEIGFPAYFLDHNFRIVDHHAFDIEIGVIDRRLDAVQAECILVPESRRVGDRDIGDGQRAGLDIGLQGSNTHLRSKRD